MTTEFACEGCGQTQLLFDAPMPHHQLCRICVWLHEHAASPAEIVAARRNAIARERATFRAVLDRRGL